MAKDIKSSSSKDIKSSSSNVNVTVDEAVVESTVNGASGDGNTPEMLEWLKDAGFGLFIHWSVDVQLGCVISHSLVGSSKDYADRFYSELPQTFNPSKWDADRVARLAKTAGVQYAVFTTKHHNGFCMWDTKTTDFNIMNTPYGMDIVKSYCEAFRKYGLKVGFYFSPEDFRFLYDNDQTITRNPSEPYSEEIITKYRSYLASQMTELMTNYGKIDLIFFDGGEMMKNSCGESLQEMCKNLAWKLQPGILVTRGAIKTPEQQLPGVGMKETWEGCITLSTAWGFQPTNEQYKSGEHVIKILMNTRAMGGSLLLNIGPDSDGNIVHEQENILREIGLWNFINREAVVGVRPWVIVNEDNIILLTDKSGKNLYAVVTGVKDWDRGVRKDFIIKSAVAGDNTVVSVLGASGEFTEYRPDLDAHSYYEQKEDGLHVSVMNSQRIYCGLQWRNPLVIKITDVSPAFSPMGIETKADLLTQNGSTVSLHANVLTLGSFDKADVMFQYRKYPGFALATYEDDWILSDTKTVSETGDVSVDIPNLESGVTYQYRAVISNSLNRMQGEMVLFVKE